jgi:HEAT repeat protein
MSEVDDSKFEELVNDLTSDNFYVGYFAAEELEIYGEKAIQPLIDAIINGRKIMVKIVATAVLIRIGNPVINPMIELLNDSRSQRIAIEFLAFLGDDDVIIHLSQLKTHDHKTIRWMAEQAIKYIRNEPCDENFTLLWTTSKQEIYDELRSQYEELKNKTEYLTNYKSSDE